VLWPFNLPASIRIGLAAFSADTRRALCHLIRFCTRKLQCSHLARDGRSLHWPVHIGDIVKLVEEMPHSDSLCSAKREAPARPEDAMRNRDIYAAYQTGKSIEHLTNQYGNSGQTVSRIIGIERHKFDVSVDDLYQEIGARKLRFQP
jgi:hypothetical protein